MEDKRILIRESSDLIVIKLALQHYRDELRSIIDNPRRHNPPPGILDDTLTQCIDVLAEVEREETDRLDRQDLIWYALENDRRRLTWTGESEESVAQRDWYLARRTATKRNASNG